MVKQASASSRPSSQSPLVTPAQGFEGNGFAVGGAKYVSGIFISRKALVADSGIGQRSSAMASGTSWLGGISVGTSGGDNLVKETRRW